jgi:hypothetical protein
MVCEVLKLSNLKTVIIPFLEKYNGLSACKIELLTFKTIVKKNKCKRALYYKRFKKYY